MKKKFIFAMMVILIFSFLSAAVPINSQAASPRVPTKIEQALDKVVESNGRAIIIDKSKNKMYLFKRNCKNEWILKKTGRCIVSEKMSKKKHYVLMRSKDIDSLAFGTEKERWGYGMIIDCYEHPVTIVLHSYTERLVGRRWIKDKTKSGNDFGIATCKSLAKYIWKYYSDGTGVMVVC